MEESIENTGSGNEENPLDEINEMDRNETVSIEKVKEILRYQITKDFVSTHNREPNAIELKDLMEQHMEAILEMSDHSDENDDYVPPSDNEDKENDDNDDHDDNDQEQNNNDVQVC